MTRLLLALATAGAALVVAPLASATPNGRGGDARTGAAAVSIAVAPAFAPSALADPAGEDWPTVGGDYGQTRYSSLSQVTRRNVRTLKPAWHVHLNGSAKGSKYKGEATPLVYQGIMYIVTGESDVLALDAASGQILWQYEGQLPETMATVCCGWAQRGVALGDGKVFASQLDSTLVALSQQTGRVVWSASNGRWQDGYTTTSAPLYYNGLVIVGVSGGEYGIRGYVTAYDARDGHRVWRFYIVPGPGDLGGATWPPGNEWVTGGGPVWSTPSVDPKTGLLYVMTGNAFPWSNRGAGDNLFTSSFLALNAMTGAYAWHFQVVHHDIWDYDCSSNPVLFMRAIAGSPHKVVAAACKTGWVYELDRKTGLPALEIEEKPVPQSAFQHTSPTQPIPVGDSFSNQCAQRSVFPITAADGWPLRFGCIFTPFDARRFTAVAPGAAGGANWNPSSYSPRTGLLYVCSRDSQYAYKAVSTASGGSSGANGWVGVQMSAPNAKRPMPGAFTALNTATNRIRWRHTYTRTAHHQVDASCSSGSVATAGGIVFMGLPEGMFHGVAAYDAATGKRLWKYRTDAGVEAAPMTYSVRGRQYVAVYAGGRESSGFPVVKGDSVYAFTLHGTTSNPG